MLILLFKIQPSIKKSTGKEIKHSKKILNIFVKYSNTSCTGPAEYSIFCRWIYLQPRRMPNVLSPADKDL